MEFSPPITSYRSQYELRQQRVGLKLAAFARAHIGWPDEKDGGSRVASLDVFDLMLYAVAVVCNGFVVVDDRHGVAAELQDDQSYVGFAVAGAQQRVVDHGELCAGRTAQRYVVNADTITVVQQNAVNVGRTLHGDL